MGIFLLFVFIAVPVIEIGLFIQVGGVLGLWTTLAIVIITAVIGSYLLRQQGLAILIKLQREFSQGALPVKELIHGAFIVVAGLLLLTPGFFTDFIGFSFFIPQVRLALTHYIGLKFKKHQQNGGASNFQFHTNFQQDMPADNPKKNGEIEGEFKVIDDQIPKIDSDK